MVMTPFEYFSNKGYEYLGEGFSHYVFSNKSIILKFAKQIDSSVNSEKAYNNEIAVMKRLSSCGYPAVKILDLFQPGTLYPNLWVLTEEKASGVSYHESDIPADAEKNMFHFFEDVQSINSQWYGNYVINHPIREKTWETYLIKQYKYTYNLIKIYNPLHYRNIADLVLKYATYRDAPKFLVMDSNVENFFFESDNQISSIIDIDHPVFGDPLYQIASIRWYRGNRFDRYVSHILSRCDNNKYALYYYFISVEDMAFRISQNLPVSTILNRYIEIRNQIALMK